MLGFVFVAVLLGGLIATYEPVLSARTAPGEIIEAILWGVLAAVLVSLTLERVGRRLWHDFANRFPEKLHLAVMKPCVIDGDTIVDAASGVRYRFARCP